MYGNSNLDISVETLINSIGSAVLVFDKSLTVRYFNKEAEKIIPQLRKNLAAEAIFNNKKISSQILDCLQKNESNFNKIRYRTTDNKEVAVNIKSLRESKINLAVVTLSDLSPLSEAKMIRSDFVSNVSHEIRSPLTSIIGFVETLQGPAGEDKEKREEFLRVISNEANRMTNLVSDLLSLSLVEAKEKRKIKGRVKPEEVVKSAIEAVKPLTVKKNKKIIFQDVENIAEIPGHPDNLLRVFINLLENSLYYSEENSTITVSIKKIFSSDNEAETGVEISVHDKSSGIPSEEIPRLTERFYRVDRSRSRIEGGTGLGLAIVKHILLRHNGKLSIESIKGKGSTFTVHLPSQK